MRVLVLGGTGTIGRATLGALRARGHEVHALVRPGAASLPDGVTRHDGQVTEQDAVRRVLQAGGFGAVVSCIASRSGAPTEAWAVDHGANSDALVAARQTGVGRFILLSAICVQKPVLAFQKAKLAFEAELQASDLSWSIVRPTAFFKSLSGQAARLRAGKPFLIFADGDLTACKPIGDEDLGLYLADCLTDPERTGRILPIGGPGPAVTPIQQGTLLFEALGIEPKFRRVPVAMLTAIIGGLSAAGVISGRMREKAELARIGRYYATESMLVWDETARRYDADATPEWGTRTLAQHYAALARGEVEADLGDHAVF